MSYMEIEVGISASISKLVTEKDIYPGLNVTYDASANKAVPAAEEDASNRRIAHGLFSAGLVSEVIGTRLLGPSAVCLSQQLRFRRPVYLGDTITATVTVTEKKEKNRVCLLAICRNQDDDVVSEGESVVVVP